MHSTTESICKTRKDGISTTNCFAKISLPFSSCTIYSRGARTDRCRRGATASVSYTILLVPIPNAACLSTSSHPQVRWIQLHDYGDVEYCDLTTPPPCAAGANNHCDSLSTTLYLPCLKSRPPIAPTRSTNVVIPTTLVPVQNPRAAHVGGWN